MTPARRTAALAAAGSAVVAAGVLAVDPTDGGAPACPFHAATGLWCPGCGSTRAVWLLLHGDLAGAVRHNVLLVPALAVLALHWLHLVAPAATARLPRWLRQPTTAPPAAVLTLAVAVVAYAVARNLPALDVLAPPASGS